MIRIHTRVESETISIPELRSLIGKQVVITVREEPAVSNATTDPRALHSSVLKYDAPFDPVADGDWEAAS